MDLKNRLNTIIEKDKISNQKFLSNVIKSDFYYLINNYFEVDFDDIIVNVDTVNNKYEIKIETVGDRMRMVKSIPD